MTHALHIFTARVASELEPWRLERLGLRLAASVAGVWQASGRRLDVWTSGRLGHVWARLVRLGLYHVRTTSRHVWARLGTSGHVWTSGDVWNVWCVWCVTMTTSHSEVTHQSVYDIPVEHYGEGTWSC
jgi:hypothetical protein